MDTYSRPLRRAAVAGVLAGILFFSGAMPSFAADDPLPPAPVVVPGSEVAASVSAVASGSDVVVDSATSPTEVTTAHPDGTFTRTVHAEPVRMETASGWKDISTDLVSVTENGKRVLKPEMVPVDVSLGTVGTSELASLDDKEGHSITQSWPFGTLPTPVVDGNKATYPGVLPGVDLIQIAHNTGVSQVLKIANAQAASDPRVAKMRLFLDAENATVSATSDGGLQAKGTASGQIELRTAAGQWWDSSQAGASAVDPGGPGTTRPFKLSLGSEAGQQTQVFGMDQILNTAGVVYPIYVDPDWSTTRTSYVYIDSGYPNTSYWNGQYTDATGHVGFLPAAWAPDGANHVTRTYYQFVTSPLAGKTILSARMDTVETWAPSCTPRPVSAWITGGVSSATTWNNKPNSLQKVSTQNVAKGYSGCAQGTVSFDMGTAKSRLTNSPQWTVMLSADNETDELGWKRFTNNPVMRVTYGTPPTIPTIYTISGGLWHGAAYAAGSTYVTRFNKPTLSVKASDPDGVNGGTIKVSFRVKNASGGIVFQGQSAEGSAAAGTLFSRDSTVTFGDGKYTLEAQAVDQLGLSSEWMSFAFTVDTTAPPPPSITAVTASLKNGNGTDLNGVVGVTPYTLSITKGADPPSKKSYDIESVVYAVSTVPIDTYSASAMTCGQRTGIFVKVCGATATITVAPVEQKTYIAAWAFDTAGNASTVLMSPNKTTATYVITVAGQTTTIPSTALGLSLQSQAELVNVSATDGKFNTAGCPVVDDPGVDPSTLQKAVRLNNVGSNARTSSGGIDTSKSFSVGFWVCNTGSPASTYPRHLLTQMAGPGSPGFAVRLSPAGKIDVAHWTGANATGLDAVPTSSAISANTWYYVAVVFDKINRQLRLTVTTTGYTGTWTAASSAATHLASPATQPVILGATGLTVDSNFYGMIYGPAMSNSVLSSTQFSAARALPNTSGVVWK